MRRFIYCLFILGTLLMPLSVAWSEVPANRITNQQETTVYITRTGEKYHRGSCRYLSKSKISTTKSQAVKNGYGACKVCKP